VNADNFVLNLAINIVTCQKVLKALRLFDCVEPTMGKDLVDDKELGKIYA
jgi:hypothetical protein